jgi:hypothetical protein
MRLVSITPVLLAAALAGCGSVHDRAGCSASTDCRAGQYCAHTSDGNVCWDDAVKPTVSAVTVACLDPVVDGSTCLRDGVLRVDATIADDHEVLGADVQLDVGGAPIPMARVAGTSSRWRADVRLATAPFPAFDASLVATVVARDGARNTANASVPPTHVTRLRWAYDAAAPISAPAVMADGTVILGLSKLSLQILAVRRDGTKAWETTPGSRFITATPTVGDRAIWVNDDRTVYAIDPISAVTLSGVGVAMDVPTTAWLATRSEPTKEWAFVGSGTGRIGAASTVASEYARSGLGDPCTTGPVTSADGNTIYVAATASLVSTLRAFSFDGAFTPKWSANIGMNVTAPLAVDDLGRIWAGSQDAKLTRTTPSGLTGDPVVVATLTGSATDSPVLLAGGDVVIGDLSGVLHRFTSAGVQVWASPPNLEAAVLAPLVLSGGDAQFVVPTKAGRVYAVRSDGSPMWFGNLDGTELRAGNIYTAPGQQGSVVSTAYFSGANGKLYAIIVDGALDAAAPWPKAFHDPRNTNRAGAQP